MGLRNHVNENYYRAFPPTCAVPASSPRRPRHLQIGGARRHRRGQENQKLRTCAAQPMEEKQKKGNKNREEEIPTVYALRYF